MNKFIEAQCRFMLTQIATFKQSCELSTLRNDGKISKEEGKTLDKINKASKQFAEEINELIMR